MWNGKEIPRTRLARGRGSNVVTRFSLVVSLAALTGEAPQHEAYINYKCVLEGRPSLPRPFFPLDLRSNLATPLYVPGET